MNQQILKLAATHFPRDGEGNICATPEIIAEFAEAIVRECAEHVQEGRWMVPPSQEQLARSIKQHFGVEE